MNSKIVKWRFFLLWLLGCVLIITRRPDMFFNPQPWAEDAAVFIRGVLDDGWMSFFSPYAGYLHILPRIITFFAVNISLIFQQGFVWAPAIMNFSTIAINSYCAVMICHSRFEWLGKWYLRLLLSMLIILFPGASEVYGNVTNVHWWLGIVAFFMIWDAFQAKKIPNWRDIGVFCLIILSTPNGLLVFPALCLLYWNINKFKLRKEIVKIIPVFVFSVIVGGMILMSRATLTGEGGAATNLLSGILGYILTGVFADLIVGDATAFVSAHGFQMLELVGFLLLAIMLFFSRKSIKDLYVPLIFLSLIIVLTIMGTADFYIPLFKDNYTVNGQRYIFIPAVIVLSILLYEMNTLLVKKSNWRYIKIALFGAIFLLILPSIFSAYKFSPFIDYQWKKRVLIYDAKGSAEFCIPINPTGWQLPLPSACGEECIEQFLSNQPVSKISLDNRYLAYADTTMVKLDSISVLRITDRSIIVYQLPAVSYLRYCILDFQEPLVEGMAQLMFLSEKSELLAPPYKIKMKGNRSQYIMEMVPAVPQVRFLRIDFTEFSTATPITLCQLNVYSINTQ